MPLRPARAARRGVIGAPVARTAALVGTTAVVAHGVGRRHDATTGATTAETDATTGATAAERGRGSNRTRNKAVARPRCFAATCPVERHDRSEMSGRPNAPAQDEPMGRPVLGGAGSLGRGCRRSRPEPRVTADRFGRFGSVK